MSALPKSRTLLDFFPPPEFLLLSTAGIAITDYDTKFVELKREIVGDGFKLVHSNQTINPEGAVVSGAVTNAAAMTQVLKDLAGSRGLRYVYATLPEDKAYLFTDTIDWVPPEGLQDAVAFIVEENAPVALDESVLNFQVIHEDKTAGKIQVAASVLPKDVVASYVELFESAGIVPVSFDVDSQALARAVIKQGDKNPYLIMNLALGKTGFYIVEAGLVEFSTVLSYGMDPVNPLQNIDDLKEEVRKVLMYWDTHSDKSTNPEKKIEKIIVCGFGASKKETVDKIVHDTGLPYEVGDVWVNLSASSHKYLSPEIFDKSLDYASAIGIALSCDM